MTERFLSRPQLKFARGELVFGYRLVRKLGEGSFGVVWLAANEKGFEWALKFVNLEGNGGQKEFKALQLIKDRKINNTNLLKLIDYGLLDHDGTSLTPTGHTTPAETAPPAIRAELAQPPVASQGTLIPAAPTPAANQTSVERLAARETQRPGTQTGDTTTGVHGRARWLVVVMEVGQQTLHDLQQQATREELSKLPGRLTRAVSRAGSTAAGKHTRTDQLPTPLDPQDEPLVPLSAAQMLPYFEQAARGLDYLHRHDIVHRDVKPQNIMLVADDAKVCDYGLASEFRDSAATTEGCTPAYAAPEAINNRPVPASDQYSLAITYVELVTGRWPFFGTTQTAIYSEKNSGRHNLSFIHKRSVRLVLSRALGKNPGDRFATCTEFIQKLRAAEHATSSGYSLTYAALAATLLLALTLIVAGVALPGSARQLLAILSREPQPGEDPIVVVRVPVAPESGTAAANSPEQETTAIKSISPPVVADPVAPPVVISPDDELAAAFADADQQPAAVLKLFEKLVLKSKQPAHWWGELQAKTQSEAAWLAAIEAWLHRNSTREPALALQATDEYETFDRSIRVAGLQRLLNQPLPTTLDVQQAQRSLSLELNRDDPFGILLSVDLEMRLAGWQADAVLRAEWTQRINSALDKPLSGELVTQRRLFETYLAALQLPANAAQIDLGPESTRLSELLELQPRPAWFTPDRVQVLAEPIGVVALHAMGKTDRNLLSFDEFKLASNKRFTSLLNLATSNSLQSKAVDAARAILLANEACSANQPATAETDWSRIYGLAKVALEDESASRLLSTQEQRGLLYYVVKLAALRSAGSDPKLLNEAITGFANLLTVKQAKSPPYYSFADGKQPQDAAVFGNLVLPVLSHPAVASETPLEQVDAASLAMLWGAKGRLLQRTQSIVSLVKSPTADNRPEAARAVELAHQAFRRARQYDALARGKTGKPNLDYLSGFGRTLADLPTAAYETPERLKELIALVDDIDPRDIGEDLELLRVEAYVRRQQAFEEPNNTRRDAFAARSRAAYERVIAVTGKDDPYQLYSLACEGLTDLHLNMSYWTKVGLADYAQLADQDERPTEGTKSYHVWRAASLAKDSLAISTRPQRENAYLALGNAQEQMAFTLGLPENYRLAVKTFDHGAEAARAADRPLSRIYANKGRCLLRHAQDLFNGLTKEDRASLLREAGDAFQKALGERQDKTRFSPEDAEVMFHAADAKLALAVCESPNPGQALAEYEFTLRLAMRALDANSPKRATYRLFLLNMLSQPDPQGTNESRDSARKFAAEIYEDSLVNCLRCEPATAAGIANHLKRIYFQEPSKFLAFLPSQGVWHEQWRSSDAWRLEACKLYSDTATSNRTPALRTQAHQLALEMEKGSLHQNLAFAYIKDTVAREACDDFYKSPVMPPNPTPLQVKAAQDLKLSKAAVATAAIRECYQLHRECLSPHFKMLLTSINDSSLDDIQGKRCLPGLSVLEKRVLWNFMASSPSLENRRKYFDLCTLHYSLLPAEDIAQRKELAQLSHDMIKPLFLMTALAPRNKVLSDMLILHKPLLVRLEDLKKTK